MNINTHRQGDHYVAKLSGKMAFSDNSAFRSLLDNIGESGAKSAVFDLSDLASIDSAGLGMFIIAADAAKKGGWGLRLKSPSGQVKQLIGLAKFGNLVAIDP